MRLVICAALAAAAFCAVPARARYDGRDGGVLGIRWDRARFRQRPLFNPALGNLVGVTASVLGQFSATIATDSAGVPLHLNFALDGTFMAPGVSVSGNAGGFTAAYNGSAYVGQADFAFSDSIAAFGDYVAGSPDATNYLAALPWARSVRCLWARRATSLPGRRFDHHLLLRAGIAGA